MKKPRKLNHDIGWHKPKGFIDVNAVGKDARERFTLPNSEVEAIMMAGYKKLANRFKESEININVGLIPFVLRDLADTFKSRNQLMFVLKNGSIIVLPKEITGAKAKQFLGVNVSRVAYWGSLPQSIGGCGTKAKYDTYEC